MAFITGQTLQGNCGPVVYSDGQYTRSPTPDQPKDFVKLVIKLEV